jgi:hypothetical protein
MPSESEESRVNSVLPDFCDDAPELELLNPSYFLSDELVVCSVMLDGCANSAVLMRHEPSPDTVAL